MTRPHPVLVAVVIAATYAFFLIFAEFAFLELVQAAAGAVRPVMAVLAVAGVAGSLVAAGRFDAAKAGRALAMAFALCATGAGLALVVPPAGLFGAAAVAGLGLGGLTVTLAASLRGLLEPTRLGFWIGAGTGTAYAFCNLPWLFAASPRRQTLVAVGLALLGAALTWRWRVGPGVPATGVDHEGRGRTTWIVWLLALVWLDSAAFYVIQHTPELRSGTWGGPGLLAGNALVHFFVALAAGTWADRGRAAGVALAAFALLVAACGLLVGGETTGVAVAYTAAVSLYSTLLVHYPAYGARPWLAAGVFAIAGWGGSALGIGMAQDLQRIPLWFLATAVVVFLGAWVYRRGPRGSGAAVGLALMGLLLADETRAQSDPVALGREVYVSEGCIHCHSQYVRPGTTDVVRWGPAVPMDQLRRESPPLPGNRRQGPDLTNVGARRSAEWNRLHLQDPQAVNPGSRMPSYAHLFAGDAAAGEALVAYLGSLGAERAAALRSAQAGWRPGPVKEVGSEGPRLFLRLCAGCHGPEGRGDGPLAGRLSGPPPDFRQPAWRRLPPGEPDPERALARLIKFGVPGTTMAGHEYLGDEAVVSLARHVRVLHAASAVP